jgi:hypothetical protein
MYSAEKYSPNSEAELLKLLSESVTGKNKVAIVGGHYMLFYDTQKDELVPLIKQDLQKENQKEFAELFTGNFPEKSIQFSVDLLNELKRKQVESKLVFIVNDHKFQSKNFQPNIADAIAGRTGELRKKYYAENTLPEYYTKVFSESNLLLKDDVQHYHVNSKQKEDNVLKDGLFFSEQRLRNKFEKNLKDKLAEEGKIRKVENSGAVEVYYNGFANEDICLTENGGCGCSGEVMEFLYELSALGYTDVFFFVPNECVEAANNGFKVVADTLTTPVSIYSIYGMGGMGVKDSKQYQVTKFCNE